MFVCWNCIFECSYECIARTISFTNTHTPPATDSFSLVYCIIRRLLTYYTSTYLFQYASIGSVRRAVCFYYVGCVFAVSFLLYSFQYEYANEGDLIWVILQHYHRKNYVCRYKERYIHIARVVCENQFPYLHFCGCVGNDIIRC